MDPATLDHLPVPGARITAVLLHPHPDMGGDRFNHVIEALYRALPPAGVGAARFDLSSSDPDRARADTVQVLDAVAGTEPAGVVLVGYSFGADTALAVTDHRVAGWVAVAPPLHFGDFAEAAADGRPKRILVAGADQFAPPGRIRERTAGWANTEVEELPGADHFLGGHTAEVTAAVERWIRRDWAVDGR